MREFLRRTREYRILLKEKDRMTHRDVGEARREWLRKKEKEEEERRTRKETQQVRLCLVCHTELKQHERLLCDSCLRLIRSGR